eukprot:SAG11_NODE_16240_length_553_cov_1.224670_2_plen_110_part_01
MSAPATEVVAAPAAQPPLVPADLAEPQLPAVAAAQVEVSVTATSASATEAKPPRKATAPRWSGVTCEICKDNSRAAKYGHRGERGQRPHFRWCKGCKPADAQDLTVPICR